MRYDGMTKAFRFGISEFTTIPWSFEEDVERYAALSVDTIEVIEDKLDPDRLDEQFARITDAGSPSVACSHRCAPFLAAAWCRSR